MIPFDRMRAAVRWATDIPSPMNRMTFLAFGAPVSNTSQTTLALRSPALASTVYLPGLAMAASRIQ
jgi:hypothetical protein